MPPEILQLLAEAPDSIRHCDFLTLEERYALFSVEMEGVADEHIQAAQIKEDVRTRTLPTRIAIILKAPVTKATVTLKITPVPKK